MIGIKVSQPSLDFSVEGPIGRKSEAMRHASVGDLKDMVPLTLKKKSQQKSVCIKSNENLKIGNGYYDDNVEMQREKQRSKSFDMTLSCDKQRGRKDSILERQEALEYPDDQWVENDNNHALNMLDVHTTLRPGDLHHPCKKQSSPRKSREILYVSDGQTIRADPYHMSLKRQRKDQIDDGTAQRRQTLPSGYVLKKEDFVLQNICIEPSQTDVKEPVHELKIETLDTKNKNKEISSPALSCPTSRTQTNSIIYSITPSQQTSTGNGAIPKHSRKKSLPESAYLQRSDSNQPPYERIISPKQTVEPQVEHCFDMCFHNAAGAINSIPLYYNCFRFRNQHQGKVDICLCLEIFSTCTKLQSVSRTHRTVENFNGQKV